MNKLYMAGASVFGLLVAGPHGLFYEERRDSASVVALLAPGVPGYRLVNTAHDGRWRVTKTVVSHPERDALVQRVVFELLEANAEPNDWRVFALLAPHMFLFVAERTAGAGLAFLGKAVLGRFATMFAGPVGIAISVIWAAADIAGPSLRGTVPAVAQVAMIRQRLLFSEAS